jgi:Xaa-Pro aminopeptidase
MKFDRKFSIIFALAALITASSGVATVAPNALAALAVPEQAAGAGIYDFTSENAKSKTLDLDNLDPETLREIFAQRRQRVLTAIPDGAAMLVYATEAPQPRRLEFQVAHSENHDFIFLTGLEGFDSLDSAILLLPTPEKDWVVLYTAGEVEMIRTVTGIEDVRPIARLEEELSAAMTDFRDMRITQIRRWPLSAALAKAWGEDDKALYLNYPRFLRLGMPEPPRLEIFDKIGRFSPEMDLRDAAGILDRVRMLHDAFSLASLRRAVAITHEGIVEGLSVIRPGMTELEAMETIDFVYRYRGAYLGFPTSVRAHGTAGGRVSREIPEGYISFVPRSGARRIEAGGWIHIDTGASFNHHSADVQRNMPVDGIFTEEQRRYYEIVLDVQKTVISMVRPGITWWDLHNKAVEMLRDAGGYDRSYTYGIGHFIGMEVHDEGDYVTPLQPGMAMAIEQGLALPNGVRFALEDDVLVTENGYEWLSRDIPIEIADVEAMAARTSNFEGFVTKERGYD